MMKVGELIQILLVIQKEQGNLPIAVERSDKIGGFYAVRNVSVRTGRNLAGKGPGLPYVAIY